eukprot:CAMPEP_0194266114 /NCGR_PEP_ID=MMETSP0169-20130528/1129_1 /TAXON_ID=218684 /ORGANISM="Corethron pennatum, Strain L29A3" /LENGTH=449 /DNA_ID=CAMNT_0039006725 /DNA_START=64 /DNA_END=1413 /DNA_ORIENTATION=+
MGKVKKQRGAGSSKTPIFPVHDAVGKDHEERISASPCSSSSNGSDSDSDGSATPRQKYSDLRQSLEEVRRSLADTLREIRERPPHGGGGSAHDLISVKAAMMSSYLSDLLLSVRMAASGDYTGESSAVERLETVRAAFARIRPLEAKMQYQVERMLGIAASTDRLGIGAAAPGVGSAGADPLSFRPDPRGMASKDGAGSDAELNDEGGSDDNASVSSGGSDDSDLRAARAAAGVDAPKSHRGDNGDASRPYRAPRLSSAPYPHAGHDDEDDEGDRGREARRLRSRMANSEIAGALRHKYGDAPEEEGTEGSGPVRSGRAGQALRKLDEAAAERERFEEDRMVRLPVPRKEKKMRGYLEREASAAGGLSAAADLGNLADGISAFGKSTGRRGRREGGSDLGKFGDGEGAKKKRKKGGDISATPMNSMQRALFGMEGDGSKKKKKKGKGRS